MKIRPYVKKLEQSKQYKDFKIKYPDSYYAAGFFILDLESGANIHQLDLYVPSQKKVAAFTLDGGVTMQMMDLMNQGKPPQKLDLNTNIDLDALKGILMDEMHNRGISEEIKKIIAVVQSLEGKKIWSLNCVLTGMEILKSHVEDDSQTVLKLEKTSLMDIMKHIPSQALMQQQNMPASSQNPEDMKKIKEIQKIEEALKKEKEKMEKPFPEKAVKKFKK